MKHNAQRVDSNQKEIVETLQKLGIYVHVLGKPVDLLLAHRSIISLAEVKTPNGSVKRSQIEFLGNCGGYCGLITTWQEGERLAKDPATYALKRKQKESLIRIAHEMKQKGQKTMRITKLREKMG